MNRLIEADGVTFKTCPTCGGSGQMKKVVTTMLGQMVSTSTCSSCNGSGKVIDKRPPSVDSTGLEMKEESDSHQNTCWCCRWYAAFYVG